MSNQRNARSMSSQPRGRKTRTQKSPSLGKRILKGGLILGAVSLVIGGGVAAFVFQNVHSTMNAVTEQEASIGDTFQTILPGNDSPITATQGRTNMLILGMRGLQDQHGGILTDSIMIMSIDRSDKTATLISLPRDLYVEVPGYQGKYKLNRAHALGVQENPPRGVRTAMETVSEVAGIPIHYGLRLDFQAFEEIVNELDGITVRVSEPLIDDNYGGLRIPEGEVKMDGVLARKYVQSRLSTSDFDRSRRQREVVKAIKREMEKQGVFSNPQMVFNILNSLERNIKTTMTPQEIKAMLKLGKDIQLDDMTTKGFTTSSDVLTSRTNEQGRYVIVPPAGKTYEGLQQAIDTLLSEGTKQVTENHDS